MSLPYDPIVARALDQLVAGVDSDPELILGRAQVEAQRLKRRRAKRVRRTAVLAFAALVLFAGAAVAAERFDVFPWLDRSDRTSASFSIDNSRTYRGPAPDFIACPEAGARPFTCSRTDYFPTSNRRTYLLSGRVEAQPHASREYYLQLLAAEEQEGDVDHAKAERFRQHLAAVSDEFLSSLNVLGSVSTIGGGPGEVRPGYELVPPAGVPMWIACEFDGRGSPCRDLASSRDVPVGTPYYFLRSSADWVEIPRQPQEPLDIARLFRAVLGRDVTKAEVQFMYDLATTGSSSSGPTQGKGKRIRGPAG